jgi:hypothetical protein
LSPATKIDRAARRWLFDRTVRITFLFRNYCGSDLSQVDAAGIAPANCAGSGSFEDF